MKYDTAKQHTQKNIWKWMKDINKEAYLSMLKVELWQKNKSHRDGNGELRSNKECYEQCCWIEFRQIPVSYHIIYERYDKFDED